MHVRVARWMAAVALLGALAVADVAVAKDVCLTVGSDVFVFHKMKSLKKPSKMTALQGAYVTGGGKAYPLTGAALSRGDGSTRAGVTVHAFDFFGEGGANFSVVWHGDATLAGTGHILGQDGSLGDPVTLTVGTCSSPTIP